MTKEKISTSKNAEGQFQSSVTNENGTQIYLSDPLSTAKESWETAENWLSWFEKVKNGDALSIYYILAIPDSWMGGGTGSNPYDDLHVKIGITKNIRRRISTLQTGTENQLVVHAMEPGTRLKELEIHKQFESDRRQGEWFMCSMLLYKHMYNTWRVNRILPPEHQQGLLKLRERINIYRQLQKTDVSFDMVNPSINDEWKGSVFLDLVYSSIVNKRS